MVDSIGPTFSIFFNKANGNFLNYHSYSRYFDISEKLSVFGHASSLVFLVFMHNDIAQ